MSQADMIKELKSERNRILKAYAKDKKIYRIIIIVLFALNIVLAWKGKAGLDWFWDNVIGKFF